MSAIAKTGGGWRRASLTLALSLFLVAPFAFSQTQSHPLSQISADTSLNLNNYNITNAGWLVYNTGIVSGGVRGIPGTDIQPSAITPSLISAGAVGSTKLSNPLLGPINVSGAVNASSFYDYENSNYYLDPASTGTSLAAAGSIVAGGWANATNLNVSSNGYFGGNVGIGTTNPGEKLDVAGNIRIPDYGYIKTVGGDIYLAPGSGRVNIYNGTVAYTLGIYNSTANTVWLNSNGNSWLNGGNVGIGTTGPVFPLEIKTSADTNMQLTSGGQTWSYLQFANVTGIRGGIGYNFIGDYLEIKAGNTERMRVTAGGNIGIGTASPFTKLHVTGADVLTGTVAKFTRGGAEKEFYIRPINNAEVNLVSTGSIALGIDASDTTGGTEALYVQTGTAKVGIKTLASSTAAGICYDTTSIAGYYTFATCSSSMRYKENVSPLKVDKSRVFQLQPVSFKWKNRDERGVGLIAEDVQKLVPEIVTYYNGTIDGVEYKLLTVYLLDIVKNQDKQIDQLKKLVCQDHPLAQLCN